LNLKNSTASSAKSNLASPVCDQVERSITESLAKAKALRQSILKKAFEGKLLTAAEIERCKAEKDYEPASVMLARIEQCRNEKSNKKDKRRK
jgi:type I restriction enzyme, S subunit